MSLILNKVFLARSILRTTLTANVKPEKFVHSTFIRFGNIDETDRGPYKPSFKKDRSQIIPVETSIKYLQSSAFKQAYGDFPVWKYYRRNFKGHFQPKKTRKTCIRNSIVSTGNPCPICRDEYLILDYRNIELLKHFISEETGEILSYEYTGICQKAYKDLLVAILRAREYGLLVYDVPYRYYDYSEWKS